MRERKEKLINGPEGIIYAIFQEGNILLEKRLDPRKPFYGFTIIPGGKVESGESLWHALDREVEEECGCIPKTSNYISSYSQQEGRVLNVKHLFVITEYKGVITEKEPEKSKHLWVSLGEAKRVCKHPSTQDFLDDINKYINEAG